MNLEEFSVRGEISDIEWNSGILHPELLRPRLLENEEHALSVCQRIPVHETLFPFLRFRGKFRLYLCLSDLKGEQERLSGARAFRFLDRFFPAGKQQQDKQSRQMGIVA